MHQGGSNGCEGLADGKEEEAHCRDGKFFWQMENGETCRGDTGTPEDMHMHDCAQWVRGGGAGRADRVTHVNVCGKGVDVHAENLGLAIAAKRSWASQSLRGATLFCLQTKTGGQLTQQSTCRRHEGHGSRSSCTRGGQMSHRAVGERRIVRGKRVGGCKCNFFRPLKGWPRTPPTWARLSPAAPGPSPRLQAPAGCQPGRSWSNWGLSVANI